MIPDIKGASATKSRPVVPFTRASREVSEPFIDDTTSAASFDAGPTNVGPFDVPARGYLRGIRLLVTAAGGSGGSATSAADGPWSVISSISFTDVNGTPLVGPFTGYDLMLVNKWGGYSFDGDPQRGPAFTDVDANGGFEFYLYVPIEIVSRDALGALPNQNASSTYKVNITIADSSSVYAVDPATTFPTVRIKAWAETWSAPADTDPAGNPQATRPPALGTTQFWSKATLNVASGDNTIKLPRVGNFIRHLILVFRDTSAVRDGTNFGDPVSLFIDGREYRNDGLVIRRAIMAEQYGYDLAAIATADDDESVAVYSFSHDFDGKPGGELRDLWLPTLQSSRLEVRGNFGAAGTLQVITNDVAPVGRLV